ncbi:uncharacterized protein LOC111829983 [Capsella rubella]|uniref:uncharacterized protein LOC111829983 n=1 Tax=Capsella rubella TaxID=81985 RepID=UPI000CD4D856|nr:uncharacterized protein LOC111829983 [Capsella rubella]
MIRRANPGTLTRLEVDDNNRFKSVFIAFGASIDGFPFMRKVIVVDGTFLKGKYLGTLLIATTQDGNYNIFPLVFAVVDTEKDDSCEWFFRQLSCVIPDDEGPAIIFDRHKSIGKAIGKVYLLASRGICTYHLHKNILLKFRGNDTFGLVKQAATAYRLRDFNAKFQLIEQLHPQLHSYLQGADLLDEIRLMLTRWFAARRRQAADIETVLTNGVEKLLEARLARASVLNVQEIDPQQYEVRSGSSMNVVNLSQKKCSCRMFYIDKLPCIHALAAAESANVSRVSKCHHYYRTDYLRIGYAKSIIPKDENCPVPNALIAKLCNSPFVRTQSGRPKVSRVKGPLAIAMERTRPWKAHACSNCGHTGHNRLTCNS